MLYRLVTSMDPRLIQNEVISLTDGGALGTRLKARGVPVRSLGMRGRISDLRPVFRLARWLKGSQPQVIQTWMYHADLVGGLAARLAGHRNIVWGIHHSRLNLESDKPRTVRIVRACARLSRWVPARIVCCSQASLTAHSALGYALERMEVIPNGFDLREFRPDPEARAALRAEQGLGPDTPVIGLVARFHPHKDHDNFIQAAAHLRARCPEVRFLLCGSGVSWENPALARALQAAGISDGCHLLGERQDMPRVFAAMDIATSSSLSEAFPMAVGEAMACGVPCVVTDVGDSALIIGGAGKVVPPRDAPALARAWQELLEEGVKARGRRGETARRRIEERFSLAASVRRYQELYQTLGFNGFPGRVPLPHKVELSV